MVYDRELKGPAQLEKGGRFAEKLTKEEAERIKQALTDALPAPAGNARVRDRLTREVSAKQTANK